MRGALRGQRYSASMSEANLRTLDRWLRFISEGDLDAAVGLMSPDAEVVPPGGQPPYRGRENLRRWMEPDALRDQVLRLLETAIAEDGAVLARHRVTARGASSGFELDVVTWSVWRFDEDGLIERGEIFMEHEVDDARDAAGL